MTPPAEGSVAESARHAEDHILVIVGTDHHPFDRLIGWTNEWLKQHPEKASGLFVQWGWC